MSERVVKNTTRPHHEDLSMGRVFRHALRAAAAYTVAVQTGLKDRYAVSHHLYHMAHDGTVSADITQTAIRDGVATANAHRSAERLLRPDHVGAGVPHPVVKIKNTRRALNRHKGRYMAVASVGSRTTRSGSGYEYRAAPSAGWRAERGSCGSRPQSTPPRARAQSSR